MHIGDVRKKFHQATENLASLNELLHGRLEAAASPLRELRQEEVEEFFQQNDPNQLERIHRIYDAIHMANGGPDRLDDDEAREVAEDIVSVYDHVARQRGLEQ